MDPRSVRIPRLVVAGTCSGVGKTTVTVALARALTARGLRVAMFKCGPDYLDPTYHARATGAPSHNLDGWMMGKDAVLETFAQAAEGAELALIEGVMGLFDGAGASGEQGSTAEIAKWLQAPVALVVDASGMARSLAALVLGFCSFDPALRVGGVVANRVGSRGHLDLLGSAQKAPPVLGAMPKDPGGSFAQRHLGLRTADEQALPTALLDRWAQTATEWLAVDALVELARTAPLLPLPAPAPAPALAAREATGCRIGVARDAAFHFYYADNLQRLRALGATLVFFSPVADRDLPAVDGLYLGGGYPELWAADLSENESMRAQVRALGERGAPIYAECGGLMYLTSAIVDAAGARHPMVGLLPADACMRGSLQALGYAEVETQAPTLLGPAGTRFRGHQFRYSELSPEPAFDRVERAYTVRPRRAAAATREGYRVGNVLASYVHAHWASNPGVALALVRACDGARRGTGECSR